MGLGGVCPAAGLLVGVSLRTPGGTYRGFYSGRQEMCMDLGYDLLKGLAEPLGTVDKLHWSKGLGK